MLAFLLSVLMLISCVPGIVSAETVGTVGSVSGAEETVSGTESHRTAEYSFASMHVYDWGKLDTVKADGSFADGLSSGVIVEPDAILDVMRKNEAIQKAYPDGMNAADFDFALTSASGNTVGEDVNPYVTELEGGAGFCYRGPKCGMDTFYVTVSRDGVVYPPVRVDVYVYGIAENVFVLDYNLPITVNMEEHGILNNDVLSLDSNPNKMTLKVEFPDFDEENSLYFTNDYGTFTLDGAGRTADVTYTLYRFMNGVDRCKIKVSLLEAGADGVTYLTGVTMEQVVTFAPANVMYYEDDFVGEGAITYINKGTDVNGNVWAVYDTPEKLDHQSPDQSENYGFDYFYSWPLSDILEFNPAYVEGADPDQIRTMLDEVFYGPEEDWPWDDDPNDVENYMPYFGGLLFGDASNDTIHLLKVNRTNLEEVLSFEFVGTGFELLSRTTTAVGYDENDEPITSYAVLTVRVDRLDENGEWKLHKAIPVISESIGGDLTQIPLVVLKDLTYGHYKVTVLTSNVREQIRLFFVDGVRVYQPLADDLEALYYKADEKNVTFTEIKTEISKGNIVYGTVSPNKTGEEMIRFIQTWGYGNTMIEDRDGNFVLVATNPDDPAYEELTPYEQYMYFGPNNEIYLSAVDGSALSYIAFYVTKDESYVGERSIQVGAHLKYTGDNSDLLPDDEVNTVSLLYGGLSTNFGAPSYGHSVLSGTEQYFSINVSCLAKSIENGIEKYLVIIGTNDPNENILALTNLKLNGYSILGGGIATAELEAIQDVFDVNASMLACQTYDLVCKYTKAN